MTDRIELSAEQARMVDAALEGRDVVVEARVGAGKTTSIQRLCEEAGPRGSTLYLTYSKLLKKDAQARVGSARVQNYHGLVYPPLLAAGLQTGLGDSVRTFNDRFDELKQFVPVYDLLVVDEYQDITEEYARVLENLRSLNPAMQTVFVGDTAQKVHSNTAMDAYRFVREFGRDPLEVEYTTSFRMGEEMAALLSKAWGRTIVGANEDQRVRYMGFDEALAHLLEKEPGDILALGMTGKGPLAGMLNVLESKDPAKFNKHTVYASIRDRDMSLAYDDSTAVFTTFDASKGLERPSSMVFNFDESYWNVRNDHQGADPRVLRNVFLVAASRGKDEVCFVGPDYFKGWQPSDRTLGYMPMDVFEPITAVEERERRSGRRERRASVYSAPFNASTCFDFKFDADVGRAFDLLGRERLDDGDGLVIDIDRTDGLIDLSAAVGYYQEILHFEGYNVAAELDHRLKPEEADFYKSLLTGEAWNDSLVLTAALTDQRRYLRQVEVEPSASQQGSLASRLASRLPHDCPTQVVSKKEVPSWRRSAPAAGTHPIVFEGMADAVHDGLVWELKFTTELTHAMFLQLGLYLLLMEKEEGVLWNTRTDERWRVTVPDRKAFTRAVVECATKREYMTTFLPRAVKEGQGR